MATLDIQEIVLFIVRMAPAIIFIMLMMLVFFSFRVELKENSMQRFTVELSDALSSSPLALHRSVFDPQKLTQAENADPNKNIELYAQNCDFGYNIRVESVAGPTACKTGDECTGFCNSVCGLDSGSIDMSTAGALNGNCGCNIEYLGLTGTNFCQCKKPGGNWQDTYSWAYGYTPANNQKISEAKSEFPAGIGVGDSVLPAKLTLNVYDSTLTRLTCLTAKAYELKEQSTLIFDLGRTNDGTFRRTDPQGTHACIYSLFGPVGCRYFPGINFEPFALPQFAEFSVTAYPLKQIAACDKIKSNPSIIAGPKDNVVTVVLCSGLVK